MISISNDAKTLNVLDRIKATLDKDIAKHTADISALRQKSEFISTLIKETLSRNSSKRDTYSNKELLK